MKNVGFLIGFLILLNACKEDNRLEKEISNISVTVNIERFDLMFAEAQPSDLPKLKSEYPFLFSKHIADSIWIDRMHDSLQQELSVEVRKAFENFDPIAQEIESLFQHLKYYDPEFKEPRLITVTSDVDYRNKTIVTDSIVLIALDTYLGPEHRFYEGIQRFLSLKMDSRLIVSDLAADYAEHYIAQNAPRTLLDDMIYYGKQLYFKDLVIPFKTDAEKMEYTEAQLEWIEANESEAWRYFIERELLFSTDNSLAGRFINDAPFSKFYLELDGESPDRIGRYLGWQIVRAYMKNNEEIGLMAMLQKDPEEIFNNSKFKPRK